MILLTTKPTLTTAGIKTCMGIILCLLSALCYLHTPANPCVQNTYHDSCGDLSPLQTWIEECQLLQKNPFHFSDQLSFCHSKTDSQTKSCNGDCFCEDEQPTRTLVSTRRLNAPKYQAAPSYNTSHPYYVFLKIDSTSRLLKERPPILTHLQTVILLV